jgi:heme-degrading monooxygenase HmoA
VFARVSTFEGSPEQVDELVHTAVEKVLPQLKRYDGFNGALALADRGSGRVLTVLLWESEEAMRASEEASYWYRRYSAEAAGDTVTSVERYEVILSELKEAQP